MKWFSCSFQLYLTLFCILFFLQKCSALTQGQLIGNWAQKIGIELWELAQLITNNTEIKRRFSRMGNPRSESYHLEDSSYLRASVEKKDPKSLLVEIVDNIARMMDRKMDAIRCISKKAEEAAEQFEFNTTSSNYTYYSSKYSSIEGEEPTELPESIQDNSFMYLPMAVNHDTHFYNLPVNTSFSAVHVPTNVYDRHEEPETFIKWSEVLDEVFRQNYKSDPALYWQYFGSSTGVMRHYPAMRWVNPHDQDLFDCRIRTWFIEAATCTKDVVILVDNSGSMAGVRKHIAAITVFKILETFSNNDYVNILNFSKTADYLVPCFKDMLAQATQENIQVFKQFMSTLDPCDKADLNIAMEKSFLLLEKYREQRGCVGNSSSCNQAIILITDGVAGNMSQLINKYNNFYNGSVIPVRIFVYLIGNEVTNEQEAKWMACNNRGYYSQVEALEQVSESVYEYIPVIARPLVLQGDDHPISWTHAYADMTFNSENTNIFEQYRLLTSVAVPAFDTKVNKQNDTRTADLLGVAATDIPIKDIEKLTLPYKIGVNAYSFIVSNNGYVLKHPDLRPLYKGVLKHNYNSIDLTEVEQLDNNKGPREPDSVLLSLRNSLVTGKEGQLHDVKVKYHYDDMRRVSREIFDYYFAPIKNTPFSIAIAIPDSYGNYSLEVGDEIRKNVGVKLTSFFKGSNWKIHPKWVYCKYHYLEGHEFDTPESELLHFLERMYDKNFKWGRQYEAANKKKHPEFNIYVEDLEGTECGRKTLQDDDYYCDKDLVQRLIFDARNTLIEFEEPWKFKEEIDKFLFMRFNATLRFVATMSGLTRWEYIFGEKDNSSEFEFGDIHPQAIDEIWYKEAVLQHKHDPDSFVYSVPLEKYTGDSLVTGSYAIFPKVGKIETPASVVGFQFSHSHLHQRFFNITENTLDVSYFSIQGNFPKLLNAYFLKCGSGCEPCGELLDCYIIDSSGYIVIAKDKKMTSKFFGEVEGAVMDSMLTQGIFEKVTVYDLQAICTFNFTISSDSSFIETPLNFILKLIKWFLAKIAWLIVESNICNFFYLNPVNADCSEENYVSSLISTTTSTTTPKPTVRYLRKGEVKEEEEYYYQLRQPKYELRSRPCDKKRDLFILNQLLFIKGHGFPEEVPRECSSNLLMVAIRATSQCSKCYTVEEKEVYYNITDFPCHKLYLNNLSRRRLTGCYNEHPLEHEIKACGKSSKLLFFWYILFIHVVILFI
ncbi:voltage-dependent calcium channel subunit alpha-2/delta-3 isoform X2 [Agrilus planipennis]|uniref:Voltage-dependent calcium channel subunit alpha-2/delta-3 isoform X2 n=1 Tax=Agrilus planipennis TaxID=224129 RepID=A0A1W4WQ36_AGRPL|nr:voltage-dependent calcium channel subunit alpha-2/delta-3 isoform X2 [Agrilus planipennis]